MSINVTSAIIIVIVVVFAFFLIYNHNSQSKSYQVPPPPPQAYSPFYPQNPNVEGLHLEDAKTTCPSCSERKHRDIHTKTESYAPINSEHSSQQFQLQQLQQHQQLQQLQQSQMQPQLQQSQMQSQLQSSQNFQPNLTRIVIDNETDMYADPIKRQDAYAMNDPLTYPQMRLSREVLDKYNEYYDKNGSYPPFNQSTQPMFDNPILNGILIKQVDDDEPFTDNIPATIPLFRVKSAKNTNRFFYYIIDQRYNSKIELKIPMDNVKLNGIRHPNADFYGLPEIYDGDIVENVPSYPGAKFRVMLYKTYHFP